LKLAALALVTALVLSPCLASTRSAGSADTAVLPVFREALVASGVEDPAERAKLEEAFLRTVSDLASRVGSVRSPYRRARRLHDALHATTLRRYTASADGLQAILERGEYNCVSATLFYGMVARALDLPAVVVASPRHVHLRLQLGARDVDVECTSPGGFDVERNLAGFVRFVVAYKLATPAEIEARTAEQVFEEFHELAQPVSLERGVAFIWHNSAQRALEKQDALAAAAALREEYRIDPETTRASESAPWCLARAFRIEYEAARFDGAYEIAKLDVEMYPGRTTPRDRLLAAAIKRIELACDRGDAAAAEPILEEARELAGMPDASRLEREACPRIASAAVLVADWERADRMVLRFLLAEPDAVESARLAGWVAARREMGSAALPGTVGAPSRIGGVTDLATSFLDSSSPFPLASPAGPTRGKRALSRPATEETQQGP
jgi:hypothetical protein